jgi:GT2 family glycosyltransferase
VVVESVVLVHYGALDSVRENFEKWLALLPLSVSVYLLNNGPSELPSSYLLDSSGDMRRHVVIENYLDNPGYLGAVERALEIAAGRTVNGGSNRFVIIANSDVTPTQFDVAELLSAPSTTGVIGPVISPEPQWVPHEVPFWRATLGAMYWLLLSLTTNRAISLQLASARASQGHGGELPHRAYEPLMIHGACFAIRENVLGQYFGRKFRPWMYCEEVLIGRLLQRSGLTFDTVPGWSVEHPARNSGQGNSPSGRYLARARAHGLLCLAVDSTTSFKNRITPRLRARFS